MITVLNIVLQSTCTWFPWTLKSHLPRDALKDTTGKMLSPLGSSYIQWKSIKLYADVPDIFIEDDIFIKKFFMEEFFQNRVRLLAVTMMEAFSKKTTTVLIFKRITNSLYNTDYRLDIFKLGHFKDSNLLL